MKIKILLTLVILSAIVYAAKIELKNVEATRSDGSDWLLYMTQNMDSMQRDSIGNLVGKRIRDSLDQAIVKIEHDLHVGGDLIVDGGFAQTLLMHLPDTIAIAGLDSMYLNYQSIISAKNAFDYDVSAIAGSSIGLTTKKYLMFNTSPVNSTTQMIVTARNNEYAEVGKDTTYIKVTKCVQPPATVIMIIGDSFTEFGIWTNELYRRLTGTGGTPAGKAYTGITFIGNLGVAPNQRIGKTSVTYSYYVTKPTSSSQLYFFDSHDKDASDLTSIWSDGTNQWTLDSMRVGRLAFRRTTGTGEPAAIGTLTHVSGASHTTDITYSGLESIYENPLWDYVSNAVSITAFCTRRGFSSPNAIVTALSWNDLTYAVDPLGEWPFTDARVLFDLIHSELPNCKIIWAPPQMPPTLGYSTISTASSYYLKYSRAAMNYNIAAERLIKEETYKSFMTMAPTMQTFDPEYHYEYRYYKPTWRYSGTTREVLTYNGIHPNTDGYYAFADAVFAAIIRLFSR